MISRLKDVFPLYKKSDWNDVFVKEAGSGANGSFVIDGILYDPYYTAEEVSNDTGILPKVSKKVSLGQVFDFRNGQSPVEELKRSLSQDFDAPTFLIDKTTAIASFDEIQLEYIFPGFHWYDESALSLIEQLREDYKSKNWSPTIVCNYEQSAGTILEGQKIYFKYDAAGDVITFINILFSELDKLTSFEPDQLIICTTLSGQFIHDIVKVRAIKIAYFNYLENRGLPIIPFRNKISWDLDKPYPEVLLAHSNNIMAAILAQADNISLDLRYDAEANRILRNSCHIALIESHLGDEPDPAAGSYFLEYVAANLAEKALLVES